LGQQPVSAADPVVEYLADMPDRITSSQDWGGLGFNTAVKPVDRPAMTLRVKDQEYQHGLGHHANGEITVTLDSQYKTFECEVGLQWQGGKSPGSVVFEVFVDGKKEFESGVMRENDAPKKVSLPVVNADELRLVVKDAGDGIPYDCADWANAKLTRNPEAIALSAQPSVNLAPFGRVVTSDAKRMKGTAASRVQEMPADDVFLETDLQPTAAGYAVPVSADGIGCIGLRWDEMRLLRRLELQWPADTAQSADATPSPDSVQLQYWVGLSPWQGEWKPLPSRLSIDNHLWQWEIASKDQPQGTVRVRWVFSGLKTPLTVKKLSALGRSYWTIADLRMELQKPIADKQATVKIYNGEFLSLKTDPAQAGPAVTPLPSTLVWDLSKPISFSVHASKPKSYKVDRTVLRIELPEQTISVAVEDVAANGCVYVPCAGLFVATKASPITLSQYLQQIDGKKSVLEDVRSRPDQTFAQALEKTRNPIQSNGPTTLSLACDNRKFIAGAEGRIGFHVYDQPDAAYAVPNFTPDCYQWIPQFGEGKGPLTRCLEGGWLPKPVSTVDENGVKYQQRSFVAPADEKSPEGCPSWYRQRALCMVEYTVENTRPTEAAVAIKLALSKDGKNITSEGIQAVKEGLLVVRDGRVLTMFDATEASPLSLEKQADAINLTGKLAPGKTARLVAYLPAWPVKPEEYAVLRNAAQWSEATDRYWNEQLAGAMNIEVPDALLTNVIRASQVHCLLAAHNEERGRYVAPWIATAAYGPLESESQSVIRGMDMCGQTDFAQRGLEFFLKRYNAQGFLTTGYTLVGTGEHLWTLAEHFDRCGDREWLKQNTPVLVNACHWIMQQRAKTKKQDLQGNPIPGYGLTPPGVTADWERYAYRFFNDTQYCHGLETIAQALAKIDHPEAAAIQADAKAYRDDLMRAYRWTQSRCPVVVLANGTWAPNHPAMLDVFGNVEEFVPAEDSNRSWCYSVEIGTHHMVANRMFDPLSAEVSQMMNYLEDHQFLRAGWFDYPEEKTSKDVYNLGGFAKVQPYYARNAEICALRDDVKPFIRSYFNALSSLLNTQNLSLWEHFHNGGAWNKTHETGWFLCQTATMFVMERGNQLWLAPMATNRWLEDGQTIAVRNAPTRFGPVNYAITSAAAQGHIDAQIDPPTRGTPETIVLRIRHPEGKPIRAVTVNGKPHQDFDPAKEIISLTPSKERITLRAEY
jgi:hypothetical protein